MLGAVVLWQIFKSTERWLFVAIPAHLILYLNPHGDVTSLPAVLAYSILVYPGIIVYYARKLIKSEKILDNWGEFALMVFLLFASLSIIWASLYDYSTIKGIRELGLFVAYLLFFPIRDHVAEKGAARILWALLSVCAVAALYGIVRYKLSISIAEYFWQVIGSREALNEPLFMSALIILFGLVAARKFNLGVIIALICLNAVALALTFSRGYWITAVIGILLLAIAAKGSPRRRILTLSALSLIAVVVVAEVVFPRVFGDLIQGLGVRLAKVGLHDISLENRFVESAAVLKKVVVSPIIGYGLGAEFTFFNIITKFSETTWYIHNAYLFLLYKFGIVGTALYLSAYFYMLIKTARYAFNIEEESTRVMLLSFVSVMCVMLIVTVTSPQFYDRVAILVLTTIWGISAGIMKTNLVTPEERI